MPELLDLAKRIADCGPPGRGGRGLRRSRHRETDDPGLRGRHRVALVGGVGGDRGPRGRRGAVRASPTSATSTRTSPARRWPRRATTPASPRPTRTSALRRPTASRPSRSSCGATTWRRSRPTTRSRSPSSSSAGCVPATPGSARSSAPDYGDGQAESAIATSTGIAVASRRTSCYLVGRRRRRRRATTPRRASATRSAGRPPSSTSRRPLATPSNGRRGCSARRSRRARASTVVLDRRVTATLLGILSGTLSGEEVAKGRSLFAGRLGEEVAATVDHPRRRPDEPARLRRLWLRRRGAGLSAQRAHRSGRLSGFLYDTYSARLAGTASTASAVRGGFKSTPGVGARALALVPGDARPGRRSSPASATGCSSRR